MASLRNSLRSLALCAAIGVAALAWRAGVEPPQTISISGKSVQRHEAGIWIQLAIMAISALLSYALAPKPPKPKPAALEDFEIPQAVQGAPFAMIFGECRDKSPVVAWYGALTSKPIKATGGKK